jgi:hypothetical protein
MEAKKCTRGRKQAAVFSVQLGLNEFLTAPAASHTSSRNNPAAIHRRDETHLERCRDDNCFEVAALGANCDAACIVEQCGNESAV